MALIIEGPREVQQGRGDSGAESMDDLRDKCADFPAAGELGIPYAQDINDLAPTLVV